MNLSFLDNHNSNVTFIVPSRRLAQGMSTILGSAQSKKVWETSPVYALEDWLQNVWQQFEIEGQVTHVLLNQMQSLLLLEEIISTSSFGKGLLRIHETAKTALQAINYIHHWNCTEILTAPQTIDEAAFNDFAQTYLQWLTEHQSIDMAQLPKMLLSLLPGNEEIIKSILPQKKIVLYGFEEMTPLIKHFFDTLSHLEWEITEMDLLTTLPQTLHRRAFIQKEQEYYACAHYARAVLEKQQTMGVVVVNLADERNAIETVFKNVFIPNDVLNPQHQVCPYYNISAATPLIQYPLIMATLNILEVTLLKCEAVRFRQMVTTVFIKGAFDEQYSRAMLGGGIVLKNEAPLILSDIIHYLERNSHNTPLLAQSLRQVLKFASDKSKKTLSEWSIIFKQILTIYGWPGERALNSVEYQLVKRMDVLFNELMQADIVLEPKNAFEAIGVLKKLAANIPFSPENKGAPIQILGLLEAIGQNFDHLWVIGMNSEAWPAAPSPNPFISVKIQKELNMPHASAQREMDYALKVTNRFKQSASHILFSYTLKEKEKQLTESELINSISEYEGHLEDDVTRCEHAFLQDNYLETFKDDNAPAISSAFKGSATTLTLQALCPFKAFAQERLGLKQEESKSIWLKPYEQGNVIHDILEHFWQHYQDLDTVNNTSMDDITQFLQNEIEKKLLKVASIHTPNTYLDVEKSRLLFLLLDYIHLEKTRAPFRVMKVEEKGSITLANIQFSIRIDRIDKTKNDEYYLIDYKTGQYGLAGIWQERLESPQLPLYFVASEIEPQALIAIKLNSKGCEYEGVSEVNIELDGIKTLDQLQDVSIPKQWQSLSAYWKIKLTTLANEFKEGHAKVAPLYPNETCRHCHLGALCRVDEVTYE